MGKNKADKGLGPEPAPHPYLPGRSRPAPGYSTGVIAGNGPLADSVRFHAAEAQLSQSHITGQSPVPGVSGIDAPAHLAYQPPMQPQHAVTLELKAEHPENAMNRGVGGAVPTVTLATMRAGHAANTFPQDVRAAPAGAAGLASPQYRGDPTGPMGETPQGAPGAVIHYDRGCSVPVAAADR